MKGKDFYNVLGLQKPSNETEVKKAYRKLAMKWHPVRPPRAPDSRRRLDPYPKPKPQTLNPKP
jgi:DnaJ-class molecular chaperone